MSRSRRSLPLIAVPVAALAAITMAILVLTHNAAGAGSGVTGVSVSGPSNSSPGPIQERPSGVSLPPGTNLSDASSSVITGAMQSDFNDLLSDDTNAVSFDASTNSTIAEAFLQAQQPLLRSVSIVPTIVSVTPMAGASVEVDFTVVVTVAGATWPTNFGTLTAALSPAGVMTVSHSSLCELVSPLVQQCPF